MRVALVSPSSSHLESADTLPLGLLCLSAQLRTHHDVHLVDLDRLPSHPSRPSLVPAVRAAADAILAHSPDVVGFSCLCNSFPFTVRVARECRARDPEVRLVFGGAHCNGLEEGILAAFPFVDGVAVGEADDVVAPLLSDLAFRETTQSTVASPRLAAAPVRVSRRASQPVDLEHLPMPDYELAATVGYSCLDPSSPECLTPVDAGRGCPFSCSFCATRATWGHPRQKSATRLLREMDWLAHRFSRNRFRLIHDSFFFDREILSTLLRTFVAAQHSHRWICSLKPDLLDADLIERFREAGCDGMFFGIESPVPRIQRRIGKVMNVDRCRENVAAAVRAGIQVTTSFIIGFPFETATDLQATLDEHKRMVDSGVWHSMVNMLAPLPASRLHAAGFAMAFDGCPSNISGSERFLDGENRSLIETHPDLFASFYHYVPAEVPRVESLLAQLVANDYATVRETSRGRQQTPSRSLSPTCPPSATTSGDPVPPRSSRTVD